eukprot:1629304-Rhodomonas_salina.1
MKETTQPTELFMRYIRASEFSCYGHCTQAMLDEFNETMDMGDDACIGMRILHMKRNPPDVGTRRVRSDPNDPASEMVAKKVDIYAKT